jgi:hypothetical protein
MQRVTVTTRKGERIPGLWDGRVVAWLSHVPEGEVEPNTGRTLVERDFLLLDHGVKIVNPCCWGDRWDASWYVDLVIVDQVGDDHFVVTDADLDLVVHGDGLPYRTLDIDELADAIEAGEFPLPVALDAMRRWQRFLDTHLHQRTGPGVHDYTEHWADFPPASIAALAALPDAAFEDPVTSARHAPVPSS